MLSEYLHIGLSLFFVILCAWIFFIIFKNINFKSYSKTQLIKIVNMVPVGIKEKIMLIEVDKKFILIGVTSTHIETLHVFDEFSELESLDKNPLKKQASFLDKLNLIRSNQGRKLS
jgi:flagellar biogenesis protein FliO